MDRASLQHILQELPNVKIAVFGDFFLDRYFVIESELAEISVETGLVAYQVVGKRLSPGAAGTVVSNLRALGVGTVICLGAIGIDGEGFELKRALQDIGADPSKLIESQDIFTPCYSKPMLRENGKERELERLDIKNRSTLSTEIETELLTRLESVLTNVDAVIVMDQVQERNCGIVTDRVRETIATLAEQHSDKIFFTDSRTRIGEFRNVIIKPNKYETVDAVKGNARPDSVEAGALEISLDEAKSCAKQLRDLTNRPIFMTAQEDGIYIVSEDISQTPAFIVEGEIDPCGAGDSCSAGIVSALCAGATLTDAAFMGNLVASITVQKIAQTGTATPDEVLARFDEVTNL